ncbi:hypothetical protein KRM28CT15_15230 [Krasilnikovia sp. M28-CT-15]
MNGLSTNAVKQAGPLVVRRDRAADDHHRRAVRAAAARVAACAADGELGAAEHDILATLAHMQINRLLGVDREVEARCYALWRHALGSILRPPDRSRRTEASWPRPGSRHTDILGCGAARLRCSGG